MTGKTYHLRDWRYYYDRATRSWWGYKIDAEGNQVADAIFEFRKEWLEKIMNQQDGVAS